MNRMKSKVTRLFISMLAMSTLLIASALPTFAAPTNTSGDMQSENTVASVEPVMQTPSIAPRAGAETWTGSGFGGAYTFYDYNLTPVKTMGKSGTLTIRGNFYGTDGFASSSPIKLTAQIRRTNGTVIGETIRVDTRSGSIPFAMSAPVSAGEQIQLYFDASSVANPPGILRSAYVEYNYAIN